MEDYRTGPIIGLSEVSEDGREGVKISKALQIQVAHIDLSAQRDRIMKQSGRADSRNSPPTASEANVEGVLPIIYHTSSFMMETTKLANQINQQMLTIGRDLDTILRHLEVAKSKQSQTGG